MQSRDEWKSPFGLGFSLALTRALLPQQLSAERTVIGTCTSSRSWAG